MLLSSRNKQKSGWLRRVYHRIRGGTKETPPTEEFYKRELKQEWSVTDKIVYEVIKKNGMTGERYEGAAREYVFISGELSIYKYRGSGYVKVKYKGEVLGFCNNPEIFSTLNDEITEYYKRLEEALEPELLKRKQGNDAHLLEILEEMTCR